MTTSATTDFANFTAEDFRAYETKLLLQETARKAQAEARHRTGLLRTLVGYRPDQPMTDIVLGLAKVRSRSHELACEHLVAYLAAATTYRGAMAALAKDDPEVMVNLRLYADGAPQQ